MAQNTTQGMNGALYAGNFIMQANAPLDDRTVVASKDKLLEYDNYVYPGMIVVSLDTNELYQLVSVADKSKPDYSGWKLLSTDQSVIDQKADKSYVENVERVTAQAINLLKTLIDETKQNQLNIYEEVITDNVSTVTILHSSHLCGNYPSITVYYGNIVAYSQAEVNEYGDVTLDWSAEPSIETPIRIILIGRESQN